MAGDTAARLTKAYAQLVEQGKAPTVRALKEQAGTSTDAAREFLAEVRSADAVPASPDLTAAVQVVWAAAWEKAATAADEQAAADLAAARAGEADALDRAAAAESAQAEAEQQAAQLRQQVAELTTEVQAARAALTAAESKAAAAETARATAEVDALRATTTVEVLQQVVRDLRPATPEQADQQQHQG